MIGVRRAVRRSLRMQIGAVAQRGAKGHDGTGHGSALLTVEAHRRRAIAGLSAQFRKRGHTFVRRCIRAGTEPVQSMADAAVTGIVDIAYRQDV